MELINTIILAWLAVSSAIVAGRFIYFGYIMLTHSEPTKYFRKRQQSSFYVLALSWSSLRKTQKQILGAGIVAQIILSALVILAFFKIKILGLGVIAWTLISTLSGIGFILYLKQCHKRI